MDLPFVLHPVSIDKELASCLSREVGVLGCTQYTSPPPPSFPFRPIPLGPRLSFDLTLSSQSSPATPKSHELTLLPSSPPPGRDDRPDLFDEQISLGVADYWERWQKPFITGPDSHDDVQIVRGAIDDLLSFNGWVAVS